MIRDSHVALVSHIVGWLRLGMLTLSLASIICITCYMVLLVERRGLDHHPTHSLKSSPAVTSNCNDDSGDMLFHNKKLNCNMKYKMKYGMPSVKLA